MASPRCALLPWHQVPPRWCAAWTGRRSLCAPAPVFLCDLALPAPHVRQGRQVFAAIGVRPTKQGWQQWLSLAQAMEAPRG